MDLFGFNKKTLNIQSKDVQQRMGTFTYKNENVMDKLKPDGNFVIKQARGMNGVENFGYSDNMEDMSSEIKRQILSVGNQSTDSDEGQSRRGSGLDSGIERSLTDLRTGFLTSEVKERFRKAENDGDKRSLEVSIENSTFVGGAEGQLKKHEALMTNSGAMMNQEPAPNKTIKFNTMKIMRHNSNPSRYLLPMTGSLRDKRQMDYYLVKTGKPSKSKRIKRTNSAYISLNDQNPRDNFYVLSPNRLVIDASSPRSYVTSSNNNLASRCHSMRVVSDKGHGTLNTRALNSDKNINQSNSVGNLKSIFLPKPTTNGILLNTNNSFIQSDVNFSLNGESFVDDSRAKSTEMFQQNVDMNNIGEHEIQKYRDQVKSSFTDTELGQVGDMSYGIFGIPPGEGTNYNNGESEAQTNQIPSEVDTKEFTEVQKQQIGNIKSDLNSKSLNEKTLGFIKHSSDSATKDKCTNDNNAESDAQTYQIPLARDLKDFKETPKVELERMKSNLDAKNFAGSALVFSKPSSDPEAPTEDSGASPDLTKERPVDVEGLLDTDLDAKCTAAKEKLTALNGSSGILGIFGKSQDKSDAQPEIVEKPSFGRSKAEDNGKFGGRGPFSDKEDEEDNANSGNPKDKALNLLEKGIFGLNTDDTLSPYRYTIGIIVRLTLIFVNVMTIIQTVLVTGNHWNWGCAPVCSIFIALEYTRVVFARLGKEWTWWVPCLLVYLLTTLPLIWQLQINNLSSDADIPNTTDIWTIVVSDATVYLTVLARWLLQGGIVTFGTLAAVIMDFFANASDIMDILSMTDQPEIRASTMLMYWVLGAWSASFIKFIPLVDLDGKSKDPKRLPKFILTNFGPMFTEAMQILFTLVFLDASFLVIRIYLLVVEGVVTFSLLFFIIKNLLAFGVQLRRLIAVCRSMPCFQKKSGDVEKENLSCVSIS